MSFCLLMLGTQLGLSCIVTNTVVQPLGLIRMLLIVEFVHCDASLSVPCG
jgi:hypothetical protein